MKTTHHQAKGFTLVELLVVIAIIASLAAMATPAIMGAMKKAKVMTAKNICVSLENAVDRFENDYSYLPFDGNSTAPSTDTEVFTAGGSISGKGPSAVMAVLAGLNEDMNPNKIKYFTLNEPKGGSGAYKDGMHVDVGAKTAELYDAWGRPYSMTFDYDLDDQINNPLDADPVVGKKVLVYSTGPDKVTLSTGMKNKEKKWIPRNF